MFSHQQLLPEIFSHYLSLLCYAYFSLRQYPLQEETHKISCITIPFFNFNNKKRKTIGVARNIFLPFFSLLWNAPPQKIYKFWVPHSSTFISTCFVRKFPKFSGNHFLEWYHDFFLKFLKVGVLKFLSFNTQKVSQNQQFLLAFFPSFSLFSLPCTTTIINKFPVPNFPTFICIFFVWQFPNFLQNCFLNGMMTFSQNSQKWVSQIFQVWILEICKQLIWIV